MSGNQLRLHGLERLSSEHGLDVRATVLRVATDLFCQAPVHTAADVARYSDLALALLATADRATRNAVAEKLSAISYAPDAVLRFLLNDADIEVSGAVLSHSPSLSLNNVPAFLAHCGPAEAAAIARRTDLDAQTIRLLAAHPHLLVIEVLMENHSLDLDAAAARILVVRAIEHPALVKLLFSHPNIHPAELTPLYPHAPTAMRARIRASLEQKPVQHAIPVPIEALSALNDAVHSADRENIGLALARALSLDPTHMDRVLDDPTGEVFALALSAAGIKRAPSINLLLTVAPRAVRESVACIFAAAEIHEATSRHVAREIVAAVVGERRPAAAIEPHMAPLATPNRGVAVQRKPFARRERRADITVTR